MRRRLPPVPDRHLTVRIITAEVTVTCADGTRYAANYRLATTLTDARRYPARTLVGLYHERWEHEIAYLALRHTLGEGRVLRSTDPAGVQQEIWALLTVYQALRHAIVAAVESRPGTDPDRASFATALHTARDLLTQADGIIDDDTIDLIGGIGRAVLDDLHPPRRPRTSVRKVKSPLSRYNKRDPYRPERSTPITGLTITIGPVETTHSTHKPKCSTTALDLNYPALGLASTAALAAAVGTRTSPRSPFLSDTPPPPAACATPALTGSIVDVTLPTWAACPE